MKIKLKDNDVTLIIHHWDCDGLLSCALLKSYLLKINQNIKIDMMMPKIGNYYLDRSDFKHIQSKNPNHIFIVDMALPKENILGLKNITNSIFIFDHHKQEKINEVEHINPMASGSNSLDFPSSGWVINNYFNRRQEILSVIGAIGDQEERVRDKGTVVKILKKFNISFNEAEEIVKNIDSTYIMNDVKGIYKTINKLEENKNYIKKVLEDESLIDARNKIEKKIKDITNNIEKNNSYILCKFSSNYHIISDVARLLSRKFPNNLIIAVNSKSSSNDNIYFRTKKVNIDLTKIIKYAQSRNHNAGGKKEVVGVFVPQGNALSFIKKCVEYKLI